ncbi:hypothetical protein [Pseudanabaena sp. FACHB-2040]|uniref:hypothetical protein n=1 Tax=Pseudanabaena sp. FACHB-2040 TaxID=2692859 RepID=UPI001687CD13|nr:hypothetical protein [Pseudanabaena sp. FACHB-2040]MBD2258033.1 hypothetical protein [Pseudanabaena sp. FACHB-2040]
MKCFAERVLGVCRRGLAAVVLAGLLTLISLGTGLQPSYAAAEPPNPAVNQEVERAYNVYGQETGAQEEIYQQRLREGENPETMPDPYKRVPSLADKTKEVPETSALETTVSRLRELIDNATN